ncbi:MAG: hypothetical protein JNM93_09055 [Bacteriovoracaceae bacterium]|nr:hypothetical protein [Bacteriovoracaceae bacterium]
MGKKAAKKAAPKKVAKKDNTKKVKAAKPALKAKAPAVKKEKVKAAKEAVKENKKVAAKKAAPVKAEAKKATAPSKKAVAVKEAKVEAKKAAGKKAAGKVEAKKGKKKANDEELDEEVNTKAKNSDEEDEDGFGAGDFEKNMKLELKRAKEAAKKSKHDDAKEIQGKIKTEIQGLIEDFSWGDIKDAIASMEFFIDDKSDECVENGCDNLKSTAQYCRLHYIANWSKIKKKAEILSAGKLQDIIEELVKKYPLNYIESIMNDFADDKEFFKALNELNIAADLEFEDEAEFVDTEEEDDDDVIIEAGKFSGSTEAFEED